MSILSEKSKRSVRGQVAEDLRTGERTEYKGDGVVDFVFAPIDRLTNTPSTREVASAKQDYYNGVRGTLAKK